MWRLHQKNIRLTLNDIKSEKVFLVIWKKGIRFMSIDGRFSRYLYAPGHLDFSYHDPAVCLLASKSELLTTDIIHLQERLMNAGVFSRRLPTQISLAVYDRKIDILGLDPEKAINEILSATADASHDREQGRVTL